MSSPNRQEPKFTAKFMMRSGREIVVHTTIHPNLIDERFASRGDYSPLVLTLGNLRIVKTEVEFYTVEPMANTWNYDDPLN